MTSTGRRIAGNALSLLVITLTGGAALAVDGERAAAQGNEEMAKETKKKSGEALSHLRKAYDLDPTAIGAGLGLDEAAGHEASPGVGSRISSPARWQRRSPSAPAHPSSPPKTNEQENAS